MEILQLLIRNHRAAYLRAISLAQKIEIRSIVEIGVYKGDSSQIFRTLFPEATLYLVDPWKPSKNYLEKEADPISNKRKDYVDAYERVKKMFKSDPKTHILRMTSQMASKKIPDGIDLVFIDGNHSYSYVKKDIQLWFPKVRSGGILSGHDYNPLYFKGVVKAVDELLGKEICLGLDTTWFHLTK